MDELVAILIIIGIIVLILFGLATCSTNDQLITNTAESESGIEYKYFTVDGMPCVYIQQGIGQSQTGGPTCDWSKWKGNDDPQ